ncbi:MAG: MBOAT family O-acyltransferase [Bacillota bacterium]
MFYFLPGVLLAYFLVPARYKNGVLLIASLFFYFYGEPKYVLLLVLASISGYFHGLWINKLRGGRYAVIPLISSIIVGLSGLLYFKYTNFFIVNINSLFGSNLAVLKQVLPIGISFYTFQILSYTIDVYRGGIGVQRKLLDFMTYVSLFPQLIAGPVVRYATVEGQLNKRNHSVKDMASGINRFIVGLAKKVIIANTLGELGQIFLQLDEKTVLFYWIFAVAFMLQIYFDFSGYSDMAIGLGRIFGFHFLENFNYPFMAKNMTEFWRRWHISLGTWFRNYVYIPLGGNRVSTLKWIRNVFVVWFLTGFWHGAQWNFVAWGLYFAMFLVLEKVALNHILERLPVFLRHFYLLFFVLISFVIFNADGLSESLNNLKGMFGFLEIPFSGAETIYYLKSYSLVFLGAIVSATPLMKDLVTTLVSHKWVKTAFYTATPFMQLVLLLVITGYLVDSSFNPFLYFRF